MPPFLTLLTAPFRPRQPVVAPLSEPLDHPCLVAAARPFLDDLPLPAYAVSPDGQVRLL